MQRELHAQLRGQHAIQLDRYQPLCLAGEELRDRAAARPNFKHSRPRHVAESVHDALGSFVVSQKMLSEFRLARWLLGNRFRHVDPLSLRL